MNRHTDPLFPNPGDRIEARPVVARRGPVPPTLVLLPRQIEELAKYEAGPINDEPSRNLLRRNLVMRDVNRRFHITSTGRAALAANRPEPEKAAAAERVYTVDVCVKCLTQAVTTYDGRWLLECPNCHGRETTTVRVHVADATALEQTPRPHRFDVIT